jgi:phosphotransferase system IIA component
VSSSLSGSPGMATGLTITAIAIAVILLASNFTIINAQQQFSQSGGIENGTIFQSTDDSFSIQVPQGWVIQDVNNTGPAFNDERTQGYGILAQLCPEEQQRAASPANASGGGSTNTISSIDISSCRGAQDVVHIIRYPDLDTRLFANNVTTNSNVATTDSILTYHLQKLQEVGYRSMQIVNSTDVTSNLIHPQTNETITTAPGKFVEMMFSTTVTPNEISRGYFILTATNATSPNLGATKGYSVFYEGNSTTSTTAAEITTAAASLPPPPSIAQLFDSFELIAAAEVAEQAAEDEDDENGDDENGDDENGDDENGDDENGDDENGDDENGDDENGDDENGNNGNNGNNGISVEELEELCEVSPGGDLFDDCDFEADG